MVSGAPKMVLELSVQRPRSLEILMQQFNYTDGEFDEEHIVDDPFTQMLVNGEGDEVDDFSKEEENFENVTDIDDNLSDEKLDLIRTKTGPIRVALYIGPGTTTNAKNNIHPILQKCSGGTIVVDRIRDGSLGDVGRKKHDVIFVPGGSAGRIYAEMATRSKKKKKLGPQTKIRRFLNRGGGYVGICAGAYLAAGGKSGRSPLKISMWKTDSGMLGDGYFSSTRLDNEERDKGIVSQELTNDILRNSQLFYANGPIFKNTTEGNKDFPELRNPKAILRMDSDAYLRILVGSKSGKGTHRRHRGSPIVVMNDFGPGKVVISTGHPETDVHSLDYNTWHAPRKPSRCNSAEAQLLISMVYLAANRNPQTENAPEPESESVEVNPKL